jgi:BlaI family penicillinase repressor
MTTYDIGTGQMKVLRVLWEKKRATAVEIADILNVSEPIKFSTVSTFLRTLVKKGVVGYDVDQRTFIYYPLVKEDAIAGHAVKNLVDHVFAGSMRGFMSFILSGENLSPDEIVEIRSMLKEKDH